MKYIPSSRINFNCKKGFFTKIRKGIKKEDYYGKEVRIKKAF